VGGGRRRPHPRRRDRRHARLHGPGADGGDRHGGRAGDGRLRPRRRPVRAADRPRPTPGADDARHAGHGPHRRTGAAAPAPAARPARPRDGLPEMSNETPRLPVRERARPGRRLAAVPRRQADRRPPDLGVGAGRQVGPAAPGRRGLVGGRRAGRRPRVRARVLAVAARRTERGRRSRGPPAGGATVGRVHARPGRGVVRVRRRSPRAALVGPGVGRGRAGRRCAPGRRGPVQPGRVAAVPHQPTGLVAARQLGLDGRGWS
jgi:23S rRNA pseudouridine2605 synthase